MSESRATSAAGPSGSPLLDVDQVGPRENVGAPATVLLASGEEPRAPVGARLWLVFHQELPKLLLYTPPEPLNNAYLTQNFDQQLKISYS